MIVKNEPKLGRAPLFWELQGDFKIYFNWIWRKIENFYPELLSYLLENFPFVYLLGKAPITDIQKSIMPTVI